MKAYLGVGIMISFAAVSAAMVYRLCRGHGKFARHIYFYAVILYAAMSFGKMMTGEPDISLFNSFYDIQAVTYIHYGIPMLGIVLIIPFLYCRLVKEDESERLEQMFNSLFSFAAMSEFFIWGVISNRCYVITVAVAAVASLLICTLYKGEIGYFDRGRTKERLGFILPVVLLWTVTVLVFEPNQLILNNLAEFKIPYFDFLVATVLIALITTLVYTITSVLVLSDRLFRVFGALLFGILLAGYIQGNFMNGEMNIMDGSLQTWSLQTKLINSVMWIVIVLVSVFLNFQKAKRKIGRVCQAVCIYLCLTQAVSLVYMVFSADFHSKGDEFLITASHALELDDENNVVVFILDWFDRQIMDQILEKDPEFERELADFTCYVNASSRYAFTGQSIPYMLTNVEWEKGMSDKQYAEYAYQNGSLLGDIYSRGGYSIGVYTGSQYVAAPAKELLINYSKDVKIRLRHEQTMYTMSKASKYKMAPFVIKRAFNYATSDIGDIISNSGIWKTNDDILFHEMIDWRGLSVTKNDGYNGAFRFYHMKGAHLMYTMDEEFRRIVGDGGSQLGQSRGSMKIVYEYIDNMKKLGVYDNATIIITADHGQNTHVGIGSSDQSDIVLTSSPILYVKLPNEHNDRVKYSYAPVSHTEFAATVINAVGLSTDIYGRTFEQIPEDEDRERVFTYVGKKYQKWLISGDVNDMSCWKIIE